MGDFVRVPIGGMGLGKRDDKIYTVLGSCVAIMLYDKPNKIGGMIHVMLPYSRGKTDSYPKYADTGIPYLIEQLVSFGAVREHLQGAKVTGGSEMFQVIDQKTNVSVLNVKATQETLKSLNIKVIASDFGGVSGRRVEFDVNTGKVEVRIEGQKTRVL